jgi:GDPmannose 4,6-dehydratase
MKLIFKNDLIKYPQSELYFEVCDLSCSNSINECIKQVLKTHSRIDELYLLAAHSHVMESFKHKELCVLVNGQSVYFFLESLKNLSPKTRTYFAGTSELIGGIANGSFDENTPWNPKSPYSIAKALGARWINLYRDATDTNMFCCTGILVNHSNTYRTKDFVIRKITNTAAKIALGKEKILKLGHLDWARDESWADFSCEAMWLILQQERPENFVIGNGVTHWGEEYVDLAFKYFNLDWKKYVQFDKALLRPNEVVRLIANPVKAVQKLGWIPERMPFKTHIELMAKYDYELESGLTPIRPDVFKLYPSPLTKAEN